MFNTNNGINGVFEKWFNLQCDTKQKTKSESFFVDLEFNNEDCGTDTFNFEKLSNDFLNFPEEDLLKPSFEDSEVKFTKSLLSFENADINFNYFK